MSLISLVHGNKAKLKRPSLAVLGCKSRFEIFELGLITVQSEVFFIFELGLIVVQTDFQNFRGWPYYGANRLGLSAVYHCNYFK